MKFSYDYTPKGQCAVDLKNFEFIFVSYKAF